MIQRLSLQVGIHSVSTRAWRSMHRRASAGSGRKQSVSDRTTGDPSAKPEFRDLALREVSMEWQRVRVRQHVNPLKLSLQAKVGPPDWARTFVDPNKPLVADVGSGYGRFLLQMALAYPHANCLGLEIREPIIARANEWASAVELSDRVQFTLANGTVSMKSMLASYPGNVVLVCVQFPDPHFKRRHRKRHIVQPDFVQEVHDVLCDEGQLYAASDVQEVAKYMRGVFTDSTCEWTPTVGLTALAGGPGDSGSTGAGDQGVWLAQNPLGVPTEREVHALDRDITIHRFLLQKQGPS
eukprot:jgi/Ulvmu1/395/UM001_0402.1